MNGLPGVSGGLVGGNLGWLGDLGYPREKSHDSRLGFNALIWHLFSLWCSRFLPLHLQEPRASTSNQQVRTTYNFFLPKRHFGYSAFPAQLCASYCLFLASCCNCTSIQSYHSISDDGVPRTEIIRSSPFLYSIHSTFSPILTLSLCLRSMPSFSNSVCDPNRLIVVA